MKQAALLTLLLLLFACSKKQQPVTTTSYVPTVAQPPQPISKPITTGEGLNLSIDSARLCYEQAYSEIEAMLEGRQPASFQRAVFLTENAWFGNQLSYEQFDKRIKAIADFCLILSQTQADSIDPNLASYWAIYTFMRDSVRFVIGNDTLLLKNMEYDFDDYAGQRDWTNTFVTRLLATDQGTCRSLPYLYKILTDKLGLEAYLKMAPNHVYIQHPKTEYLNNPYNKGRFKRWYNVELTSGCFPSDGWIAASAYISLDAIRSGLYMRRLKNNQDINLCLLDLAQGYERKFGINDPFLDKCINLALKYDTESAQAKIMQAELLTKRFKQGGRKELMPQMEEKYTKLFQEGYAEMPREMYFQWLYSMRSAGEKGILADSVYKPFKEENEAYERQLGIPLSTMSDGRFKEIPDTSRYRRLGSVMLDTKTGKVVAVLELDTLYSEATMAPEIVSRWLSTDPVTHPHQSPYTAFDNNPIFFIDPTGKTAGKYLDKDGKVVGDDGINDGKAYLVADNKEAGELSKTYNGEKNVVQGQVKSAIELPNYEARTAISESVDRTIQPTGSNIEQGQDPHGNFHEEGGFYYEDENGKTIVVNAKPGRFGTPEDGGEVSINEFDPVDVSKMPASLKNGGAFHTHPGGIWHDDLDLPAKKGQPGGSLSAFIQPPSDVDIQNARDRAAWLPNNSFVLAVRENRVYIYNQNTPSEDKAPSLPLSTFRTFKP